MIYDTCNSITKIRHFANLQAHAKICVKVSKARIAKTVLNKKYRVVGLALPNSETYRFFLIKKTQYQHKDSLIEQLN